MPLTILFSSQDEDLNTVDFRLEDEYNTAKAIPGLRVAKFSFIIWFKTGEIHFDAQPEPGPVICRAFMMFPEQYADFYSKLRALGLNLVTSPEQYTLFHLFPNIYPQLVPRTPKALWFPEGTPIDYDLVNSTFKSFMLKDYVKSVKESKFPKKIETPIDEAKMGPLLAWFRQERSEVFTGGFLFKEFVNFKTYKVLKRESNEYRAFFANGKLLILHPNSDQPPEVPVVPRELVEWCENKGSVFYTVDFAELEDGTWIIIEAGDGQYCGSPKGMDLHAFIGGIAAAFGNE
jgi:hypothetical protein